MPVTPDLERKFVNEHNETPIIYRLVLTGGPCSGKTTGQARLSTFFENLGWKVYRVPETATVLFSGGIRFPELDDKQQFDFQVNLVRTMLAIESTFFSLAESSTQNCLVICDRGVIDASAYMNGEAWEKLMKNIGLHTVDVRDNRYHQVIHLVTAADGAEEFYNCEDNPTRTEGIDLARERDVSTSQAWVGHPYIDIIDNSSRFEDKLTRMLSAVCRKMGIEMGDRLDTNSKKLKYLVGPLPISMELYPPYQDFEVIHDYLVTSNPKIQSRLRKRGQQGVWSYQFTTRRADSKGQTIEVRRAILHRDYITLLAQRDDRHHTIFKTRRCFMWHNMYFQMDIYKSPCHSRCDGLVLLETYSTMPTEDVIKRLPPWLPLKKEVTGDPAYSMYNLSLKEEWTPATFVINGRSLKEQDGSRRRSSALNTQIANIIDVCKDAATSAAQQTRSSDNNNQIDITPNKSDGVISASSQILDAPPTAPVADQPT